MAKGYYPTKHAVKSMSDRDIGWAEVLWVLAAPEVTYSGAVGKHAGKHTEIHQRGRLYVVVAQHPTFEHFDTSHETPLFAVITVGLRRTQVWTNQDAIERNRDEMT